ncbi:hypothetical protein ACFL0Q_06950 [Thermodesulfobacteriota bacterium]
MITDYQAKYFAHELTRRFPPDSVEKITVAFAGAQVDLNPHQTRTEAIAYGDKAVFCLEKLPRSEASQRKIIDARCNLSKYYTILNWHVEAKEVVDPIKDLAHKIGYKKSFPVINGAIGSYYVLAEGDMLKGTEHLLEAVEASESIGDDFSLLSAIITLGSACAWNCEFDKALSYFDQAMTSSVAENNPNWVAWTKWTIGPVYWSQGKLDTAYQMGEEVLNTGTATGNIVIIVAARFHLGFVCYFKGFHNEAERHLLSAFNDAERIGLSVLASMCSEILGDAYHALGQSEEPRRWYSKGISLGERHKTHPWLTNLCRMKLAREAFAEDDRDIDIGKIIEYRKGIKVKSIEGQSARVVADILMNLHDPHWSEAKDWIKRAIEADKNNGMRWELGRDYALYAELFKRKGDLPKAREQLTKAIDIMKECGADGWVTRYEEELVML